MSPALLCERLRVYLLGSVWPIRCASETCARNGTTSRKGEIRRVTNRQALLILGISSLRSVRGPIEIFEVVHLNLTPFDLVASGAFSAALKPPKNIFRVRKRQDKVNQNAKNETLVRYSLILQSGRAACFALAQTGSVL
jgi:hypothetical protein